MATKYQQSSINTALRKVDSTLFKVDNQLCFLRKLDIIHSSSRLAMPFAKLFGNILLKGVYFLASYKLCGFLGSDFVGNWFVDLHRKQILYFIIRVCGRKLAVKSRVRISRTLNILRFIRRRIKLWYTVTVAYWYWISNYHGIYLREHCIWWEAIVWYIYTCKYIFRVFVWYDVFNKTFFVT